MPLGRPREFDIKVMVRVTADLPARIKTVLRPNENMAGFFRTTATRELEKREKAADRRKEAAPGRRAHAAR